MKNDYINGSAAGSAAQAIAPALEPAATFDDGVVLIDFSLRLVGMDRGGTAILNDASRRMGRDKAPPTIPREVAEALARRNPNDWSGVKVHFRGMACQYRCTVYYIEPQNGSLRQPIITLHLHKGSSANDAVHQIATEFSLTPRESEVLTGISVGLTSKEVAQRLNISPNTVKTYLRLIMVKLGVTTRSAIVGKLLNCDTK